MILLRKIYFFFAEFTLLLYAPNRLTQTLKPCYEIVKDLGLGAAHEESGYCYHPFLYLLPPLS